MSVDRKVLAALGFLVVGCGDEYRDETAAMGSGSASASAGDPSGDPSGAGTDPAEGEPGETTDGETTGPADDDDGEVPILDVGSPGSGGDNPGGGLGCKKVDFLFVVDNSSSMLAHQEALATSFPGWMSAITGRLDTSDFHVMVVDTDTRADQSDGCGECHDRCVLGITKNCGFEGPTECESMACGEIAPEEPDSCDYVLGAGVIDDRWQQPCSLNGDGRFLTGNEADLQAAFECVGRTGVNGTGKELPLTAMTEAVRLSAPGECNEGFIRDDAILVVTIVSDALMQGESTMPPLPWYDALVDAKNGRAENIVVLALLRNEPDSVPGPGCQAGTLTCGSGGFLTCDSNYDEFVRLFGDHGFMHSICIDDYTPFFSSALDTIELTCDEFEPEG